MLFTAMLLSLTQRSSHSRLQSHSSTVVWNSLETHAALKDPVGLAALPSWEISGGGGATGGFISCRLTHRDFRDTRLSKAP